MDLGPSLRQPQGTVWRVTILFFECQEKAELLVDVDRCDSGESEDGR